MIQNIYVKGLMNTEIAFNNEIGPIGLLPNGREWQTQKSVGKSLGGDLEGWIPNIAWHGMVCFLNHTFSILYERGLTCGA